MAITENTYTGNGTSVLSRLLSNILIVLMLRLPLMALLQLHIPLPTLPLFNLPVLQRLELVFGFIGKPLMKKHLQRSFLDLPLKHLI
jgi:hypothetical protein